MINRKWWRDSHLPYIDLTLVCPLVNWLFKLMVGINLNDGKMVSKEFGMESEPSGTQPAHHLAKDSGLKKNKIIVYPSLRILVNSQSRLFPLFFQLLTSAPPTVPPGQGCGTWRNANRPHLVLQWVIAYGQRYHEISMVDGCWLVGGWPTPLKNDGVKVSWDDDIPNIWKNKIWKNKKCSKPPTS